MPEKKQKKAKSPLLVIFTIFILAIFIILPPVFRNMFPKKEVPKNNNIKVRKVLLTCTKTMPTEGYEITSKVKYLNGKPDRNTIIYSKNTITQEPNQTPPTPEIPVKTVAEELKFFSELQNIEVTEGDTTTTVVLNKDTISSNSNNLDLTNYFLPLGAQQKLYQEQGYECSRVNL